MEESDEVLEQSERTYGATRPDLKGVGEGRDLSFFLFHESCHAGQIALARRCLGLPGLIGPSDAPEGS